MNRKLYYILLGLFGAAVWLFFAFAYQGHLHFTEGNQAFLFTGTYARETILDKGGLANYVAAFLTQFYYWPATGGFVIALVCVLTALGISGFCRSNATLPLSFIIPAAYAVLMLDGNWVIAGLVGICCFIWIARVVIKLPATANLIAAVLLAWPVGHYLLRAKFFEYMVGPESAYFGLVLGTVLICAAGWFIRPNKEHLAVAIALYALIFAGTALGAIKRYDALDEEIHRYEYMVRTRNWDGILKYSKGRNPSSPLSTNAVNLALEMKGLMGDQMFRYYQSGPRSLANFEERKISSEILFLLGFVNEAQHIAFEDMAGNPNRTRGVYHITRLAQFGSVGERSKELNEKYLNTLKHTLFYRNFKPDTTLVTPEMEPAVDFFFDFKDFERNLRILHSQRPENRRVADYLAASMLLNKNLTEFGETFCQSDKLPRHWQEAKDLIDVYNGGEPSGNLSKYILMFDSTHGNRERMGNYSGTYWYYANFR